MTLHRNARTCPESRELIARRVLDEGWTLAAAAGAAGVSVPTARKWVRRRARGESLEDRPSAPRRVHNRTPADRVEAVLALRRIRLTADQIAEQLEMAPSTVSLICKRAGLGRRPGLEPTEPERRYERKRAGELIHVDVKKLGRIDRIGHRVGRPAAPAITAPAGRAGTTSTSASTMPPESPTPRCSQTSTPRRRSLSFAARLATWARWGSRSSG